MKLLNDVVIICQNTKVRSHFVVKIESFLSIWLEKHSQQRIPLSKALSIFSEENVIINWGKNRSQ